MLNLQYQEHETCLSKISGSPWCIIFISLQEIGCSEDSINLSVYCKISIAYYWPYCLFIRAIKKMSKTRCTDPNSTKRIWWPFCKKMWPLGMHGEECKLIFEIELCLSHFHKSHFLSRSFQHIISCDYVFT